MNSLDCATMAFRNCMAFSVFLLSLGILVLLLHINGQQRIGTFDGPCAVRPVLTKKQH